MRRWISPMLVVAGLLILAGCAVVDGCWVAASGLVLASIGLTTLMNWKRRKALESLVQDRSAALQRTEEQLEAVLVGMEGTAQQLQEVESRYRTLFESSGNAMMILAPPDWRFTAANPATVALFGARGEPEFLATAPWQVSPERQPDGRCSAEKARAMIETALREGSHLFEWMHRRLTGEDFPTTVLLTRTEIQGQVFLQATVCDITAQKQVEATLRADHDRTQLLLQLTQLCGQSAQSILAKGLEYGLGLSRSSLGFVGLLNEDESTLTLQHWSSEAFTGGANVLPAVSWPVEELAVLGEAIRQREPVWVNDPQTLAGAVVLLPGQARIERYLAVPVFDGGRIVALLGVANKPSAYGDDDARSLTLLMDGVWRHVCKLRAEEALWENQNRFRTIFEKSPDAFLLWQKGLITDCNQATLSLLGRSRHEVVGRSPAALSPSLQPDGANSQQKAQQIIEQALQTGSATGEWLHQRGDGEPVWVDLALTATTIQGEASLFASLRNITERKQAEAALRESEQQFRCLVEDASDVVYKLSPQGEFLYASPAWTRMLGHETAEVVGRSFREIVHPDDIPACAALLAAILSGEETAGRVEHRARLKHAEWRWFRNNVARAIGADGQPFVLGVVHDIHEQKLAEAETLARLERVQRQLQALARILASPAASENSTTTVESILQHTAETLEVERAGLWLWSSDGRQLHCQSLFQRTLRQPGPGTVLDAESCAAEFHYLASHSYLDAEDACHDPRTQDLAESYRKPLGIRSVLDVALRWSEQVLGGLFLEHTGPPRAWQEDEILFASTVADYLAQRQANQQRQQTLESAQRRLEHVDQAAEVHKLAEQRAACRPAELFADLVSSLQPRAKAKGIALRLEYASPIPETMPVNPGRLRQLLAHLLDNALKFTEQGEVRLVVSLQQEPGVSPRLACEVHDTGIGMPSEQSESLFQPSSSMWALRPGGPGGHGLGLAICRRLAEMLEGTISVRSQLGEGSTFTVTITTGSIDGVPLVEHPENRPAAPEATSTPAAPSAATRVLVAEDTPDVQRLIVAVLRGAGHEVIAVENGQQVIDEAWKAAHEGRPFDLILMDMQMPVVDGCTATARLRSEGYHGPIVALTAHAMAGDRQKCLDAGCDEYLAKPIDRELLVAVVRGFVGLAAIGH